MTSLDDTTWRTRSYRQTVNAAADKVFPLLCPVREAEWLDGWSYQMLASHSGLVERGAVFSTPGKDEPDTIWITTEHDTHSGTVRFARFTPGNRTCLLDIQVSPVNASQCHVDIRYTYTALSAAGQAFLAQWNEESFLEAVKFWERSINHYLKHGTKLLKSPV